MKERDFQKKIKWQLESQAAFIINVHGHGMQISGLPDLQVIHRNWKGWLELKINKGKCSSIQRVIAAKIELRGMPVYVLRCVEIHSGANFTYSEDTNYIIENFQGEVIKEFGDLGSLLDVLIELKNVKHIKNIDCGLCNNTGKPCDSCGEYHPSICMCPPHEVRMKWQKNVCPDCNREEGK